MSLADGGLADKSAWPLLPAERSWGPWRLAIALATAAAATWCYLIGEYVGCYLHFFQGAAAMRGGCMIGMLMVFLAAGPMCARDRDFLDAVLVAICRRHDPHGPRCAYRGAAGHAGHGSPRAVAQSHRARRGTGAEDLRSCSVAAHGRRHTLRDRGAAVRRGGEFRHRHRGHLLIGHRAA